MRATLLKGPGRVQSASHWGREKVLKATSQGRRMKETDSEFFPAAELGLAHALVAVLGQASASPVLAFRRTRGSNFE